MAGSDQRTEKPTPQRLRKAREDGRFPVSREFAGAVQFAVFVALSVGMVSSWWPQGIALMRRMLTMAFHAQELDRWPGAILHSTIYSLPLPLALAGGAVFAAGLFAHLTSTGFGLAASKLAPDFSRLDPTSRLGGLLKQNGRSAAEAVALLACIAVIVPIAAGSLIERQIALCRMSLADGLAEQGRVIGSLLRWAALFLFVWGAWDLYRARRRYGNELKMTKQEIKDEFRQNDGNPEIKMRIRRLRRELLRRRMMSQVAEATAVITNPTHYAVALKYDFGSSGAPRIVAKGKNYLALRIRRRAAEHQVPIVENPPLARALYSGAEVGSEIPAHLYRAVAEVLAYVFRMLGRNGREGR